MVAAGRGDSVSAATSAGVTTCNTTPVELCIAAMRLIALARPPSAFTETLPSVVATAVAADRPRQHPVGAARRATPSVSRGVPSRKAESRGRLSFNCCRPLVPRDTEVLQLHDSRTSSVRATPTVRQSRQCADHVALLDAGTA